MNVSKLQEPAEDRGAWHATVQGSQRFRHDLVTQPQQHKQKSQGGLLLECRFLGTPNSRENLTKAPVEVLQWRQLKGKKMQVNTIVSANYLPKKFTLKCGV